MKHITLYTRELCGWCHEASDYLKERGIAFQEIDIGHDPHFYEEMKRLSGQHYVPTIVIDGKVLANFDTAQLEKFLKTCGD